MKTLLYTILIIAASTNVFADGDLTAGINALDNVQQQNRAIELENQRQYLYQQEQERQRIAEIERQRAIAAQKAADADQARTRAALQAAQTKAKLDADLKEKAYQEQRQEQLADKYRNQAYEDQLRQQELEDRKLELDMKRAKVKRADDYIDRELKREDARTDTIQADADATRNVSAGERNLRSGIGAGVENAGKAADNKANNWFH